MNLKRLLSKCTIGRLTKLRNGFLFSQSYYSSGVTATIRPSLHPLLSSLYPISKVGGFSETQIPKDLFLSRFIHTAQETALADSEDENEDAAVINEFLSRFVWIMRRKITEAYPDYDKKTIDTMLLVIVEKVIKEMEEGGIEQMLGAAATMPSEDLSAELWATVWEVSNMVLEDMKNARKKEKMKEFLQSDEVKKMCRFASEVGIRGDMLRELRFKWARQKMEESEIIQSLEEIREEEAQGEEEEESDAMELEASGDENENAEPQVVSLPKRHGKINYKIYGLDLSDAKWAVVADKLNESGEVISYQESKPIMGKCKIITEEILSLQENDDPSPLLSEWIDLLRPSRVDWINLLDKLKERNVHLYLKIAEHILGEESFQTNTRDYSKLIDAHARENRFSDAERIIQKMNENGISHDILTATIMVHMYTKWGNLDRAKAAFEILRIQGLQPDTKLYNSMISAYVNAGEPTLGESLMREMEARDIKPTKEIYMALLRSFAQRGHANGAERIATTMQFADIQPSLESCTLLVEAFGQAGNPDKARHNFDHMMKLGFKPDDKCTASMIAAYEKKNLLDKALDLLLQLEKDGFEPGVATYTVLVDWMCKMGLLDEAEQLLDKISQQGEAPHFKVNISLCDMYARARIEKKALQTLEIVKAKKEQLVADDFERIIYALVDGGFLQDARRMHELMGAQGFASSESLRMALTIPQTLKGRKSQTQW